MSGGSLEYIYLKVDDIAHEIIGRSQKPLHQAFAQHLLKVAEALHDLEWVYSGDWGEGDEEPAIRAVLHPSAEIDAARKAAEVAMKNLQVALKECGEE